MLSPIIEAYHSLKNPFEIYASLCEQSEVSFFLDTPQYAKPDQQFSYLGFDPFLEVSIENKKLYLRGANNRVYAAKQLFKVLRRLFQKYQTPQLKKPFWTGGAVGYWGYEMAELFERIRFKSKPGLPVPELFLGFYRSLVVYDHLRKHYWLVAPHKKDLALLKSQIEFSAVSTRAFHFHSFRPETSRQKFYSMVRKAKKYIQAGDIYQTNLSQRFKFDYEGSPLRVYQELRRINPSPFASFLKIRDLRIVSSSPERLIRKQGNLCETRPIAGTRPRKLPGKNLKQMTRSLLASAKERAEHIMLVDLERNDLGRVCDYKTVKVEEMMGTEKYSHVIHIVSKITGRLKKEKDGLDLLKAVFPGGTITGCPKVRCMEIIDELEKNQRGIYTGSIGYLDFQGNLDLNIVIRTLVMRKNKGYLQVGAGIVYDSDEKKEYQETLHKGEALKQALLQAGNRRRASGDR